MKDPKLSVGSQFSLQNNNYKYILIVVGSGSILNCSGSARLNLWQDERALFLLPRQVELEI
jgi:hypothetical protein